MSLSAQGEAQATVAVLGDARKRFHELKPAKFQQKHQRFFDSLFKEQRLVIFLRGS